jgi:hypothetical protein
MTQADRVLSTPPTNTSSRRNFLAQAAVVAAGGAALGVVLPLPVSAGDSLRVPDPILAAIETHKAAAAATEAAHKRLSAFENELADNERLTAGTRTRPDEGKKSRRRSRRRSIRRRWRRMSC